jgi:hypothetical protein
MFFTLRGIYVSPAQLAGLPTPYPWGLREPAATKISLAAKRGLNLACRRLANTAGEALLVFASRL